MLFGLGNVPESSDHNTDGRELSERLRLLAIAKIIFDGVKSLNALGHFLEG